MKKIFFCVFLLTIIFTTSKVLCNDCLISQIINQKTHECIQLNQTFKSKCNLGKLLLKEYFNVTKCDTAYLNKKILKRSILKNSTNQSCLNMPSGKQMCFTSSLIFNIGSSAHATPCTQATSGYQKCCPKNTGTIVCSHRSFKRCEFYYN